MELKERMKSLYSGKLESLEVPPKPANPDLYKVPIHRKENSRMINIVFTAALSAAAVLLVFFSLNTENYLSREIERMNGKHHWETHINSGISKFVLRYKESYRYRKGGAQ